MVSRKLKIILLIHIQSPSSFVNSHNFNLEVFYKEVSMEEFINIYIVQKLESLRDSFVQISEKRISSNVEGWPGAIHLADAL